MTSWYHLFTTFNIPSPMLTLNPFSALYYFATNCTIILQLLQSREIHLPSALCPDASSWPEFGGAPTLHLLSIPSGHWLPGTKRLNWNSKPCPASLPALHGLAQGTDEPHMKQHLNQAVICRPGCSSCETRGSACMCKARKWWCKIPFSAQRKGSFGSQGYL